MRTIHPAIPFALAVALLPGLFATCQAQETAVAEAPADATRLGPYEASLPSLAKHKSAPEWFRDAKLGIYLHWGVYSVPANGSEWYPRTMHLPSRGEYKHHLAKYGTTSEFGYHDFVPMFKAEKFDAAEWADLFQRSGAKFAGPVAEHHDGFAMWDSNATPWNSADMGPHRDITGELEKEIRARDMKFITSFHHARNLQRYADKPDEKDNTSEPPHRRWWNSHFPWIEGTPPTSDDPKLRQLYGNMPEGEWLEKMWFGKLKEVIDSYQPDIIWFDAWLDEIPTEYHEKFAAYYLNSAAKWGKEVVIVRKNEDLPLEYSINDYEKGRASELTENVWLTDDTISNGSWSYTENLQIKSLPDVLHVFIDIVSKNGQLLLNLSPMADGTIPQNQKEVMLGMGEWLGKYGEAIYDTRPFVTAEQGPTKLDKSGHFVAQLNYTAEDVRYTASKDSKTVYAIQLGVPAAGSELTLTAFGKAGQAADMKVKNVTLLGNDGELDWKATDAGLQINAPTQAPDKTAQVYKIELQ